MTGDFGGSIWAVWATHFHSAGPRPPKLAGEPGPMSDGSHAQGSGEPEELEEGV